MYLIQYCSITYFGGSSDNKGFVLQGFKYAFYLYAHIHVQVAEL